MSFIPLTPSGGIDFTDAQKYLADRGIDEAAIQAFGIKIVPPRSLNIHEMRIGIKFPFFDLHGDPVAYWSARMLGEAPLLPDGTQAGKMLAPTGVRSHVYFPLGTVPTRGARVYFHESVVKALNGHLVEPRGIHLGLNGVRGYSSKAHGFPFLLPEITGLPWEEFDLQPFIVFDSDYADNSNVELAIATLAAKIKSSTGRECRHLELPAPPEDWLTRARAQAPDTHSWGLDDFRAYAGDAQVLTYLRGTGVRVAAIGMEAMKLKLNEEVAVVSGVSAIVELSTGQLMSRSDFVGVNYADYSYPVTNERSGLTRYVSGADAWLRWDGRNKVSRLDYIPGTERGIVDGVFNVWPGWGCDPDDGDVSQWLDIWERNITDPSLRMWVLQWLAYPIQHPGAKLNTFLHLWGPPGTGKNSVIAPFVGFRPLSGGIRVAGIYGDNAWVGGKDDISANFNSQMANRQFVMLDEIHGGSGPEAVRMMNKLKPIITGDTLDIERKGIDKYTITNCLNVVTASNHLDSLRLDDGDRRCVVIGLHDTSRCGDISYWNSLFNWYRDCGVRNIMQYLLGLDLTGFDPGAWAPETADKLEMTFATRRVDEQWVARLAEDPDSVLLPIMKRSLYTSGELAQCCYTDGPVTQVQKNRLGQLLYSAQFERIELKIARAKERFWVVRGRDEGWDSDRARKHLRAHKFPGA